MRSGEKWFSFISVSKISKNSLSVSRLKPWLRAYDVRIGLINPSCAFLKNYLTKLVERACNVSKLVDYVIVCNGSPIRRTSIRASIFGFHYKIYSTNFCSKCGEKIGFLASGIYAITVDPLQVFLEDFSAQKTINSRLIIHSCVPYCSNS